MRETERLFEVLQVYVVKNEGKDFDVIVMRDYNTIIELGAEENSNGNGKRLLKLVRREILVEGIS